MGGYQLVRIVQRVKIEQLVLAGEYLAALVELSAADAHVVILHRHGHTNQFTFVGLQPVDGTEGAEERQRHGSRRRKSADGQRALDDATQAARQRIATTQLERGTTQIVRPVALTPFGDLRHMPLCTLVKLQRAELDNAVLLGAVGDVDALVDSQTRYLTQIVVRVRPDRADTIRTERQSRGILVVYLMKSLFAIQHTSFFKVKNYG